VKEPFDCSGYSAAILAASVHLGRHEREMAAFVKRHRDELTRLPSAFLSVSLSAAGAEDDKASSQQRAESAADVDRMLSAFFHETGWLPDRILPVAGALRYTKYGLLLRWIMMRKARKAGASTDTSRDHALTDWEGLDRFIRAFLDMLPQPAPEDPARERGEASGPKGGA
jgi:menaquinone-dependent protoporphyrinogen oxidase